MNFRQLDCFINAAECKSFSAAGKKLYLSQSTISQQIISLENELGCQLFARTGHAVSLTPAGEYLYPRLVEMRNTLESVMARAKTLASEGRPELILGYDGPIAESWLGSALEIVAKGHATPPFIPRRSSLAQLTDMLLEDAVDVIITCDTEVSDASNISFAPLLTQTPCVFFPAGHRFSDMSHITPKELEGETVISAYNSVVSMMPSKTGSTLIMSGTLEKASRYFADGDTAFMAVRAGHGVFIASHLCNEFAARHGVESIDLHANLPLVTMGIAWKQDDPRIDELVATAKRILAKH